MRNDIIFIGFVTSLVLMAIMSLAGVVTQNYCWFNAAAGAWIVFMVCLVAGLIRTIVESKKEG